MKKILFIILSLLIYHFTYSQNDKKFQLKPSWIKGESKKYEIKTSSNLIAENETKVNDFSTQEVIIEVVDVNDKYIDLIWDSKVVKSSDSIDLGDPFSGLISNLSSEITVKYRINKKGKIIDFLNLDEISERITLKIDSSINLFIKKEKIEKEKADLLRLQFSMMYTSDMQIKSIFLNDIQLFHQIYGCTFSMNKTTIIPDNIFAPNINGEPSNNLELSCTKFKNDSIYNIEGKLKCSSKNEKMRKFIQKDRNITKTYKISSPSNWLLSHKSIMKFQDDFVNMSTTYEITLIK